MKLDLLTSLYVFMLAAFIGFEVIRRVSPLLHTPLMSLTNALDAIAVVGAIILAGEYHAHGAMLAKVLGTIAIVAATSNIVGGFLITDRMLRMFKRSEVHTSELQSLTNLVCRLLLEKKKRNQRRVQNDAGVPRGNRNRRRLALHRVQRPLALPDPGNRHSTQAAPQLRQRRPRRTDTT